LRHQKNEQKDQHLNKAAVALARSARLLDHTGGGKRSVHIQILLILSFYGIIVAHFLQKVKGERKKWCFFSIYTAKKRRVSAFSGLHTFHLL
jgi:hypothetical protein